MSIDAWWQSACCPVDHHWLEQARAHQATLTKPRGSLGRLEALVERLAGLQGRLFPELNCPHQVIFAGDHGVVAEGISAFPQSVTAQMLANFAQGGAAISVLARQQQMPLSLIDLGTIDPHLAIAGVTHLNLGPGTANFTQQAAMSEPQCQAALAAGRAAVVKAKAGGCDLFLAGEMGIGNTTIASALACALTGRAPAQLTGPGTGLNSAGVQHKQAVIERGLMLHQAYLHEPFEVLRRLGGFEVAALAGAYIACAQEGIPALVDGFICSAAALCALRLNPEIKPWLLFAHSGAEPGHALLLLELDAEPLLDLGLRLGEGSGAALALPLVRLACALHREMATFSQAGVEEGQ